MTNPFSDLALEVLEAARLAVAAHDGQRRKLRDLPYAVHPLRVAARVAALPAPDPARLRARVLAAVLHDVLEDTAVPAAEIEARFGTDVLGLVRELTQDMTLEKTERRRRMIEHCGVMSQDAQVVKLADRLDNVSDMDGMPAEFIARYTAEAVEMLARMRGACPELEEAIRTELARFG